MKNLAALAIAALGLGVVSACNRAENAGQAQTSAQPPSAPEAVAKAAAPSTTAAQTAAATPLAADTMSASKKEAVISVEGMSCMSCVATITRGLNTTAGVTTAKVDLEKSEARIEFDPAKVNVERLTAVIKDLGYKATPAAQAAK